MPHRFVSDGLWNTISAFAKKSAVRRAAIAYVPDTTAVRFRAGDTLVTHASETAIASGSTAAHVLGTAIDLGAEVYSVRGLHAKVLRLVRWSFDSRLPARIGFGFVTVWIRCGYGVGTSTKSAMPVARHRGSKLLPHMNLRQSG